MSADAQEPPPTPAAPAIADTPAAPTISAAPTSRFTRVLQPSVLAAALILLHALLLAWSSVANSVTFDEYAHLPAGVSYWRDGEFEVYAQSPPLLRLWSAAPVMLARPGAPPLDEYVNMLPKDRHWAFGEAFLRLNFDRYHRLFVIGRLAMIPLSCLGAWVVYRWASTLYGGGGGAGVIACAAYALCPNLCAHGSVVGTDAPTGVVMLLAAWLWWRFCRGGSWKTLAAAVVAIGAAHLCKFTALLLWPMLVGIAVFATRGHGKRVALGFAVALLGCLLILNVGYAFERTGMPVHEYALRSAAMTKLFANLPPALPVPLPEPLVLGFDALKWEFEQGLPSFLFGELYAGSKWYYYPVALGLKVPLATWALFALALWRRQWTRDDLAVLACAAVFLLGAMLLAGADPGVRYALPVLPLAFVLIGRARPRHAWLVPALLALLAVEHFAVAPRYLTFFNPLAGGRDRGQLILNDSNFDWGQGLIDLRKWMRANDVPRVHLGYFGRVDPATYGIDYDLLTDVSGEPYIAISSYFLAGLPHRLPSPRGPTGRVQLDFAPQLRAKPRVAVVAGGTIHVFRREHVAEAMREARAAAGR